VPRPEKIGESLLLRLVSHGSGYYLRLPTDFVEALDLQPRDMLKVTIEWVRRRRPAA